VCGNFGIPLYFRKSVCGNLLLEILSVHIISFEDSCKKTEEKTTIFYTLSTLLVVFSISLIASSVSFVFSTIIQLCIIV
jgi:hypothetical protein